MRLDNLCLGSLWYYFVLLVIFFSQTNYYFPQQILDYPIELIQKQQKTLYIAFFGIWAGDHLFKFPLFRQMEFIIHFLLKKIVLFWVVSLNKYLLALYICDYTKMIVALCMHRKLLFILLAITPLKNDWDQWDPPHFFCGSFF